jgi:hypothetical protein
LKRKSRGRFTQRSFAARVKAVIMKNTETKFFDIGGENIQLFHDVGAASGPTTNQVAIRFNPWASIPLGTNANTRVGDMIKPVGIKLRLWMANKQDRPNLHYRVIVAILPKIYNGVVTAVNNFDLFAVMNVGVSNSTLTSVIDVQKGVKVLYDRVIRNQLGFSAFATGVAGDQDPRECHRFMKLWITRKKSKPIKYDAVNSVVNNPLCVYVIPYDSFGTLQTDNVASCTHTMRLYYKDV